MTINSVTQITSQNEAQCAYSHIEIAELNMTRDTFTSSSTGKLEKRASTLMQGINIPHTSGSSRYQSGMTLIEIMIALLIGAFLLGGILQVFIGSKQTYRMQEGLSRLQENGRFALEFLSKDIRMSGFIGCASQATLTNILNSPTNFLYDFGTAIQGFESTSSTAWTPTFNNTDIVDPLGGSDILTIRRAADQGFSVVAHATADDDITLEATATTANLKDAGFLTSAGANKCATAIVSDCSAAAVFQITGVAAPVLSHATGSSCTPDNSATSLGKTFVGAEVYPINTISYFVKTGPGLQPSLYRQVDKDAVELVEGIESMQVLYGEDSDATPDGTANYYVTAQNVTNMARVTSVRITLTARSLDSHLTSTGDGIIRRKFTSTIAIRNRLS